MISDVHGFYNEMIFSLNEIGFNPETDFLISLGDEMDRGPDPEKVINYLMSLPHAAFVCGNHTDLMKELLDRRYPCGHDYSNRTFQSVLDLAPTAKTFEQACIIAEQKIKPFFDKEVNYFETENYVFVHGFIPVNINRGLPRNYKSHLKYSAKEDWRYAHQSEWDDAKWLNGMEMVMDGFGIEKTIICGHFHTSWGHAIQDKTFNEFGDGADFSPFYYEDKLIAIDGCTAYTGKVNVLVLEDEFLIKE